MAALGNGVVLCGTHTTWGVVEKLYRIQVNGYALLLLT